MATTHDGFPNPYAQQPGGMNPHGNLDPFATQAVPPSPHNGNADPFATQGFPPSPYGQPPQSFSSPYGNPMNPYGQPSFPNPYAQPSFPNPYGAPTGYEHPPAQALPTTHGSFPTPPSFSNQHDQQPPPTYAAPPTASVPMTHPDQLPGHLPPHGANGDSFVLRTYTTEPRCVEPHEFDLLTRSHSAVGPVHSSFDIHHFEHEAHIASLSPPSPTYGAPHLPPSTSHPALHPAGWPQPQEAHPLHQCDEHPAGIHPAVQHLWAPLPREVHESHHQVQSFAPPTRSRRRCCA